METHQNRLLDVVYWSLGTTTGVVLLLMGFSWFVNFKIHDRDKLALRGELTGHVDTALAELATRLASERAAAEREMQEKAREAARSELTELASQVGNMRREFLKLKLAQLKIEADDWQRKEVFSNVLYVHGEMLRVLAGTGMDWRLGDVLDGIKKPLLARAAGTLKFSVPPDTVAELNAALDTVPGEFALTVSGIKTLLQQVATS